MSQRKAYSDNKPGMQLQVMQLPQAWCSGPYEPPNICMQAFEAPDVAIYHSVPKASTLLKCTLDVAVQD